MAPRSSRSNRLATRLTWRGMARRSLMRAVSATAARVAGPRLRVASSAGDRASRRRAASWTAWDSRLRWLRLGGPRPPPPPVRVLVEVGVVGVRVEDPVSVSRHGCSRVK